MAKYGTIIWDWQNYVDAYSAEWDTLCIIWTHGTRLADI